jgi:hypothetical protein
VSSWVLPQEHKKMIGQDVGRAGKRGQDRQWRRLGRNSGRWGENITGILTQCTLRLEPGLKVGDKGMQHWCAPHTEEKRTRMAVP